MLRVVELAGGFVLQPLEVPGPDLARALGDWLAARGHPAVVREPRDNADWEDLAGWLLDARPPPEGVVMVLGSRDPPEGVYLAMRLVNERRDTIGARLGCTLFWCGPPGFLELTAERAPDFWSVRAVERRLRLKVDRLDDARRQGDPESFATLLVQRAREALSAGKLDEGEALLAEMPQNPRVKPAVYVDAALLRADVARQRGKMVLALGLLLRLQQSHPPLPALDPRISLLRGRIHETAGHAHRAEEEYVKAEKAAENIGDRALLTLASVRRNALQFHGDSDAAVSTVEQGRRAAEEQGDLALAALVTALLAGMTAELHDLASARGLLEDARELARRAEGKSTVLLPRELEEALAAADREILGAQDEESRPPKPSRPVRAEASPPNLITERLRQARAEPKDGARLDLYNEVLALDPKNAEAIEGKRETLQRLGASDKGGPVLGGAMFGLTIFILVTELLHVSPPVVVLIASPSMCALLGFIIGRMNRSVGIVIELAGVSAPCGLLIAAFTRVPIQWGALGGTIIGMVLGVRKIWRMRLRRRGGG
jgi:tetratricopeptide (TPR) repeat protein